MSKLVPLLKSETTEDEADEDQDHDQLLESREENLEPSRGFSIWEHFTKVGESRAQCNICRNIYNYATTVGNLKAHLARRHIDAFQDCEELVRRRERVTPIKPRGPRTVSIVWNYFEKLDKTMAECTVCKKQFSYKSTVHNLKMHLTNKHPDVANCLETEQEPEVSYEDVQYLDLGNEDSESSKQTPSDARVWEYFQSEGKRARCGLCEVPVSPRRLRQHLADCHPGVLAALLAQDTDDEDEKPFTQARTDPLRSSLAVKKRKLAPQASCSEDEAPFKKRKDEAQDSFLQYIATLLRDTPQQLHLQLQMDIVNVIMKARLAHEKELVENANRTRINNLAVVNALSNTKDNVAEQALNDIDSTTRQRVKYKVLADGVGGTHLKEVCVNVTTDSLGEDAVGHDLLVINDCDSAVETVVTKS